ncbi:hypothetical protein RJ640_017452 [Escallonia rubra]|uniref:Pentatricopeptide repeat-containing protein n=1 Tax=Escallonia rubra TaxID=112253 RepID=A0AA88SEJ4_9ASTE|nr:hypothetical protein RJ640_017452 [Escallonia rubra]
MMWKSSVAVAIAARRRASSAAAAAAAASISRSNSLAPHQVPSHHSKTLASYKPHPHFSSFHRNPIRTFSEYSSIATDHHHDAIADTSLADPRFPDIINQPDPIENMVFDENPSSVPSESEDTTAQLDEFLAVGENENPTSVDAEQLESVLSLLQSSVDGSLEFNLDNMKLTLNEEFVVRVLGTPLVPGKNLIGFFKWALTKPEVGVTTPVVDSLVQAIGGDLRKRDVYALWDLVKEIGEKENGVLTTKILNELLSLLSRLGKGKAAFEVFNKFTEFACAPDADSYYYTVEALCRRSIFDWAGSVCEEMLNAGELPDKDKTGTLIRYLCKGQNSKVAHAVYLAAKEKDRGLPRSSVNFLIGSLCRGKETVQLALKMLENFSGDERKYAIKPFLSVIRGLCWIKDLEGANNLLSRMIDAGPPPGNAAFNFVINSLAKAGDMKEAIKIVEVMESRGLKPDVYTYSVIMSGYAKGGEMEEACKILAEAKKKHSKLSPATYHTLIRGYCKLEEFDKAVALFGEMKEHGVQPNVDEYNKLIQSLCLKAVDWRTAEKLLEEMKENGLHLNGITKGLMRAVKELEQEGVETQEVTIEA